MTPSRETIYAALASLVFSSTSVSTLFKTTGRWLRPYQQVPGGSDACPALYLVEHPGEEQIRIGKGMDPKRILKSLFVMYFYTANPSENSLQATACNNGIDALEDAGLPGAFLSR